MASKGEEKRQRAALGQQQRLMQQGTFLDQIMAHKREELAKEKREVPLADLRAAAAVTEPPRDFAAALRPATGPVGVRLIAEIKRASPSKGLLCHDFDPVRLADVYSANGAAAISILTDARFFQGDLVHISQVRQHFMTQASAQPRHPLSSRDRASGMPATVRPLPLLRKDFIFDPYQLWAARAAGADALLLIAAVLGDRELRDLLAETRRLQMEALIEVHDEGDVRRALAAGARIIGVNNRDLRTFAVDLATTARLRPLVPPEIIFVAESGIQTAADVHQLAALGVDAMLVGEAFVKAAAAARPTRVRELAQAGLAEMQEAQA
ncbi:indole-3-glycerol phosphate synthase TrpC [Candidatus Amarolinea dominans]|uniref:indole-3-glycerol phosphate synthase TrpC n=1 Tax=Candidatus Amarolinea dominans TaxID=3140696 RepID=UPI0031CC915C